MHMSFLYGDEARSKDKKLDKFIEEQKAIKKSY